MQPLVFEPFFRPQVWGGRRLEAYLGRAFQGDGPIGEAWMLSAQTLHVSRVAEGPHAGTLLTDLWAEHCEEFAGPPGRLSVAGRPFPLLFKYLDCQELLSIQVHPDDATARRIGAGDSGKTEAWIVLDAEPAAQIYAGLLPGTTRADVERHLEQGTLVECLNRLHPRRGDCIFIPAGTVHAVGGGVLMAEVQQSSDATFRLFDWNRLGQDGRPRELHIEQSLAAIDWAAPRAEPQGGKPISGLPVGVEGTRLIDCPFFTIDRFTLTTLAAWSSNPVPSVWMVIEGEAELSAGGGYRRVFRRGETVLVPRSAGATAWRRLASQESVTLLAVPLAHLIA